MSVLIGGGSGFVGTALVRALKIHGLKTRIITRKPGLQDTMTWEELSKNGLPEDAAYVVNLAGANLADFTKKWEAGYKKEVFDSRIDTTKNLADAISTKSKQVKVFLQASAVGFYPPSESAEYSEESPGGDKTDVFTELCALWEDAGKFSSSVDTRRVILRFGVVLGRDGGYIKNVYFPFYLGLGGPVGSGGQWFPWIHVDDLVDLTVHLLLRDGNARGIYNAVSPQPCTSGRFAKTFARSLNRPALLGTPKWLVESLFDKDRSNLLLTGQKVLPKRTLESGYVFKYPDVDSACQALAK